jgi:hypothetical protein
VTNALGSELTDDGLRRDLIGSVTLALVCALGVIVLPGTALKAVFAVPFCLLIPGYLIRTALFAQVQLEPGPRLMLIPALSLVTLILSSLLLNEFPGGLQKGTWVGWLVFVDVVAALVTDRRRHAQGGPPVQGLYRQIRLRRVDAIVLGLAAIVAVGAYVASRLPLSAKNIVGYETLSVLPNGADTSVTVTARSGRTHTYGYRLDVSVGSRRVASRSLRLAPGSDYALDVGLGPATAARRVTATLQIVGAKSAPRQVNVTLPAAPSSTAKTRATRTAG